MKLRSGRTKRSMKWPKAYKKRDLVVGIGAPPVVNQKTMEKKRKNGVKESTNALSSSVNSLTTHLRMAASKK